MKKLFLLSLLFPCLCTFASGEIIDKQIDFKIESRSKSAFRTHFSEVFVENTSVIIALDDGSYWQIKHANKEDAFARITSEWSENDEIRITEKSHNDDELFALKNMANSQCYLVDFGGYTDSPKAYLIDQIDRDGYVLASHDGTYWAFGYWGSFTTSHWHPGDRIAINKSHYSRKSDYLIFNLDRKDSAWGGRVRWRNYELPAKGSSHIASSSTLLEHP